MIRFIIATDITVWILVLLLAGTAEVFSWDENFKLPATILTGIHIVAALIGFMALLLYVTWHWALN